VHLFGLIIRLYHDAQPSEYQSCSSWFDSPNGPRSFQCPCFVITLRHTPHSLGLLWRSDKSLAELLPHKRTSGPRSPHCLFFMITFRHSPFSRTPLHNWSAHRRGLYLTTHTTLNSDIQPCSWRDSNPQSQQLCGHREFLLQYFGLVKVLRLCS
jgi:hypothetical protein